MRSKPGRFALALLEWTGQDNPSVDVQAAAVRVAVALIAMTGEVKP